MTTRRIIFLTAIILLLFAVDIFLDFYLTTNFAVLYSTNRDLSDDLMAVSLFIWIASFSLLACDVGLIIPAILKQRKSKMLLACLIVALVAVFFFAPVIHLGTRLAPRQICVSHCDHGTCACIIFACYTGDSWCSISYRIFGIGEYYCVVSIFPLVFCYVMPRTTLIGLK